MVCDVTSIVLAVVVVTLGVSRLRVVVTPAFSTSIGAVVSTPEKVRIPPVAALNPRELQVAVQENVHV